MPDIGDQRVQPAFDAMLAADVARLRSAIGADPEIVTIRWGGNTLLEWVTQPPHGFSDDVVEVLIASGSPLDRPLNLAACWDLAELCERLLAAGADPTAIADEGVTPLESAAMHGSTRSGDVLASRGIDRRSLWLAAAAGAEELVDGWIAPDGRLTRAPGPYRPNLVDVGHPQGPPVVDGDGAVLAEAMVFAGANGRLSVVDLLAGRGVSVDASTHLAVTALHLAILFGNPDAVAGLLERGARTNLHDGRYDSDAPGWALACLSEDPLRQSVAALFGVGGIEDER